MIKRALSLALVLITLLVTVPVTDVDALLPRKHITDRTAIDLNDYTISPIMQDKLDAILDGEVNIFKNKAGTKPVDAKLGTSNMKNNGVPQYVVTPEGDVIEQGTSCFIYANGVYYTLFGETTQNGVAGENSESLNIYKTGSRRANYKNFKAWGVRQGVGALIRASGHSLIVLSYDEESITYLDGNGNGRGLVSVNHEKWEEFYFSYVYYIIQPTDAHYKELYGCGSCGEEANWCMDPLHTLTLSGTGSVSYADWEGYEDRIRRVVVNNGVSAIDDSVFLDCPKIQDIFFYGDMPQMAQNALEGVTANAYYPATKFNWNADKLQDYGGTITWIPYGITELQITRQPEITCTPSGELATVSIDTEGDGVTYHWYFKNPDSDVYVKSTANGASYSVTMCEQISGRQIYCVVKDQYGNSITSESVALLMDTCQDHEDFQPVDIAALKMVNI